MDVTEAERRSVYYEERIDYEELKFFFDCAKENLSHARHVENERLTFVSLFLVSMGMILEYLLSLLENEPGVALVLTIALLLFDVICTLLLIRWNNVFQGHMALAQKYMREVEARCPALTQANAAQPDAFIGKNSMYYFANLEYLKLTGKRKGKKPFYVSTASMFFMFNILTYFIVVAFLVVAVGSL